MARHWLNSGLNRDPARSGAGAGQGLGRDYALAFAEAGAIPVLAEINAENLRNVAAEVEAKGARAQEAVDAIGELIANKFGEER